MFGTIRDKRCDKYTHPGISAQKKPPRPGLPLHQEDGNHGTVPNLVDLTTDEFSFVIKCTASRHLPVRRKNSSCEAGQFFPAGFDCRHSGPVETETLRHPIASIHFSIRVKSPKMRTVPKSCPLAKRKRANPADAFRKHLIRPHETYAKFSQFSVIGRYQLSGLLRRLRNVSSGMSGLPRRATRSARKDGSPRRRAKRIRLKKRLPL